MKKNYKPTETEEFLGLHVFRPIASKLVQLISKTFITPNQLTWLSLFFAMLSAYFLIISDIYIFTLLSAMMLFISNVFDNSDGQLARLRGIDSIFGRMLDGFVDNLSTVCIYVAMAYILTDSYGLIIWLITLIAGISHSIQCSSLDYYRNEYIDVVSKNFRGEKASSQDVQKMINSLDKKSNTWFNRLLLWIDVGYTQYQETVHKKFFQFRNQYQIPNSYVDNYKKKNLPLLKLWALMGQSTHLSLIIFFILIESVEYYLFLEIIALNLFLIVLKIFQNRVVTQMQKDLTEQVELQCSLEAK